MWVVIDVDIRPNPFLSNSKELLRRMNSNSSNTSSIFAIEDIFRFSNMIKNGIRDS
jgi:hypothetical protein